MFLSIREYFLPVKNAVKMLMRCESSFFNTKHPSQRFVSLRVFLSCEKVRINPRMVM